MGNDWFHEYFINELKAIGNYSKCADGKSAYQYAVDGGYTGTEAEFAKKLASKLLLVNITESNGTLSADKAYSEIWDAIIAGTTVFVYYNDYVLPLIVMFDGLYFGTIMCDNGDDVNGAAVGSVTIEITPNDEVNDLSAQADIPKTLPNPNAITFTGAVTGSYDGSAPLSVEIPIGADGKSAYQYAQDGGYTGTEAEFAAKLASGDNFYIDLAGSDMNYTCPMTMDDIKAAYNAGYNLVCRCTLGAYTSTLPLFLPMPNANLWVFSGSGALTLGNTSFSPQSFTVAITGESVVAQFTEFATIYDMLPNPNALTFTGAVTGSYDGSKPLSVKIPREVTDDHINSLIDTKLGVIENGSY